MDYVNNEMVEAAEIRKAWKDVGKIAYSMGRMDVSRAANGIAKEIGAQMVARAAKALEDSGRLHDWKFQGEARK